MPDFCETLCRIQKLKQNLNCTSLKANIHEIRSRLIQQRPDVVLIQETNLSPEQVIKFEGYGIARVDRSTPRHTMDGSCRGGGVMILVSTAYENLSFEILPSIVIANDNTTETVRIRLHIEHESKLLSIDIMNIYIPPITGRCNGNEERTQNFSAINSFTPVYDDYEDSNSMGLIIAGDEA